MSLSGSLKELKNLEIDSRVYLLLKKIWTLSAAKDRLMPMMLGWYIIKIVWN